MVDSMMLAWIWVTTQQVPFSVFTGSSQYSTTVGDSIWTLTRWEGKPEISCIFNSLTGYCISPAVSHSTVNILVE